MVTRLAREVYPGRFRRPRQLSPQCHWQLGVNIQYVPQYLRTLILYQVGSCRHYHVKRHSWVTRVVDSYAGRVSCLGVHMPIQHRPHSIALHRRPRFWREQTARPLRRVRESHYVLYLQYIRVRYWLCLLAPVRGHQRHDSRELRHRL